MSGSDVWLVAQPRPELGDRDWAWLTSWLAQALGVELQAVTTSDPAAAGVEPGEPLVLYGDRRFLDPPGGQSDRPRVRIEATPDDWLLTACRQLRDARTVDRLGAPTTAVLDRCTGELGAALDQYWPGLERWPYWPAPYSWALVLTHDVDAVDRWSVQHLRHLARHVPERWGREGARAMLRLPWAAIRGLWDRPPLARRLLECIRLEERYGVRATYLFFAPLSRHRAAFDGWYTSATRLDGWRRVCDLWRDLLDRGFDVGLHLSIGAHAHPDRIAAEWDALRAVAPGLTTYRSHHCAAAPNVTMPALAALGAKVDLNLVATGFAWGSGLPFPADGATAGIYRVTTVVEDGLLEADGNDPAVRADWWGRCEAILEETARNGSLATVLIHPENPGSVEMLERVLGWAKARNGWITSVREMIAHWEARGERLASRALQDLDRLVGEADLKEGV